jgi:hypothetical protein
VTEYVADGDWNAVRRNFELDGIDTGGQLVGIRFGNDTVTWGGGSPNTAVLTVDHGLPRTPVMVVVTSLASPNVSFIWDSPTATSFDVQGSTIDGTSPAAASTAFFSWIAIG